jgi:TetR/AcrR family transcriptional regulator, regulator of cefoperazone and chloramphenicol sensitivity
MQDASGQAPEAATRQRILDAALDLFGERGLTGTTVRDIAGRAKVNVAAISYHFGGKDELYRAVAQAVIGSMEARVRHRIGPLPMNPPKSSEAALSALQDFAETIVDVIVGPPEMRRVARFIIREQMQPTAAFEILYGMMSRLHSAATGLMALATGLEPESKEAMLRVFMMIGQVLFFRIAETAVSRRLDLDHYDEAFLTEVKALVRQNVRATVLAARRSRT